MPQLEDSEAERKTFLLLRLLAIHAFDRLDRPTHTEEGNLLLLSLLTQMLISPRKHPHRHAQNNI